MRLTLIVANLKGGGVQRAVCNIANTAYAQGVDIRVLALTNLSDGHLDFGRVPVSTIGKKTLRSSLISLYRYLRIAKSDECIIAGQPHVNLAVLALAMLSRSKARIFITEHNPIDISITAKEGVIQKLKWLFYRRSAGIICVGRAIEDALRERANLKDHPIVTIYNPVVPPTASKSAQKRLDSVGEDIPFEIVCIGRLQPQKNFALAISAAAKLQQSGINLHLRIVGEGKEAPKLKALAENSLNPDSYVFDGFQDDIYTVLSQAHCLLMTSKWEGFGIVAVEALLVGVTVVSTNCPGPAEILADGKYGELADHTPDALAECLQRAMVKPRNPTILKTRADEISNPVKVLHKYLAFIHDAQ